MDSEPSPTFRTLRDRIYSTEPSALVLPHHLISEQDSSRSYLENVRTLIFSSNDLRRSLDLSSHSLIRSTSQPCRRSVRLTFLSRFLFASTFSIQNFFRVFEGRLHSHPCQKHPSTKITIRRNRKTKSGFPVRSGQFIRHPATPPAAKQARMRRSVVRPCCDLTSDIMRERAWGETLSIVC